MQIWKSLWYFLTKLNLVLPLIYDVAITLLGIYPTKLKNDVYTKAYKHMFIAALFIVDKNWKQPRNSSIGGWINKTWYSHTIKYYLVI